MPLACRRRISSSHKGGRKCKTRNNPIQPERLAIAGRCLAKTPRTLLSNSFRTLDSGNQIQGMLLDGTYTSKQLHNIISRCSKLATELGAARNSRKQEIFRNVLDRIDLHDDRVVIRIDNRSLLNIIRAQSSVHPTHTNLTIERQAIRLRSGKALRLAIPPTSSDSSMLMRDEKLIALIAES